MREVKAPQASRFPGNSPDWLDRESDRFDAAWQAGGVPQIDDFLPDNRSVAIETLRQLVTELVMIDLEHRWRRTKPQEPTTGGLPSADTQGGADTAPSPTPPIVEDYVARFRRILPEEFVPDELMVWEFRVRHRWGDHPQLAEYQRRFPDRSATLLPALEQTETGGSEGPSAEAPAAGEESLLPPDGMIPAVEELARQLTTGGLLAMSRLRAVYDHLPPDDRPQDAAGLARCLREAGDLTAYQAQAIAEGKLDSLVLGSYVLLEPLGAGGMGQVFKARHRHMDRVVALKTLPPEMVSTPAAVRRFQREIEIAAQAEHPHLVAAYDADEANGIDFLVMPYAPGRDLATVVDQDGPLPIRLAVACVFQAAQGLAHLHSRQVIHRDVKPSNLLLSDDGTVKVVDFGLARLALTIEGTPTTDPLTSIGHLMGTADYMAPEQAQDAHRADHRSDIYGLGCTLFYLLTARPVFGGESLVKRLLAHRKTAVPSLRALRPDVPVELEAVFQRALAKRPEDRYSSMQEMIAALEACPLPPDSTAESAQPRPLPRRFRRRVLIGALSIAGALLIAVLLVALSVVQPAPSPLGEFAEPAEASDEVGVPVDLLALADVERDAISGSWGMDQGTLVSPPLHSNTGDVEYPRLRLPYVPPTQYKLALDIRREADSDGLILGLVVGGRLVAVALDTTVEASAAVVPHGGGFVRPAGDDSVARFPDQTVTSVDCTVTENEITLAVSGSEKPVTIGKEEWEATPLSAELDPLGRLTPFLALHRGRYRFQRLQLTPLQPGGAAIRTAKRGAPEAPFAPRPVRRYVRQDAPRPGNGTSWEQPFAELRDALAWAPHHRAERVELWVAQGTYRPTPPDGDRSAAFRLPDSIALYGGFAGHETQRAERDPDRHRTILSGDILGDDSADPATKRDNCYHVIVASDTSEATVLDGFTIRDGWADGSPVDQAFSSAAGGGLFLVLGAARCRNCVFTGNTAGDRGGAVYAYHSAPSFVDCRFERNQAGRGGGLAAVGEFENPRTSRMMLQDCVFANNVATRGGGGMFTWWGDPMLVANCAFTENEGRGSGLYHSGGGAVYLDCTPMVFFQCTFVRNTAAWYGGAVHAKWNPQGTFVNCTWYRNTAQQGTGGAIFAQNSARPLVYNSILHDNRPDQLASYPGAPSVAASYSCLQGGWPGEGNIDADPQWPNAEQGDFMLPDGSPSRSAGRPLLLIRDDHDLDRNGNREEPLPIGVPVVGFAQRPPDLGSTSPPPGRTPER